MGWLGFRSSWCSPSFSATTICPRNSGRYFPTASSSAILPSSTSIITAVAVMGLDCEAIQNIESVLIAFCPAISAKPTASTASTLSLPTTSATAPASSCFCTKGWSRGATAVGAAVRWATGNARAVTSESTERARLFMWIGE